MKLEINALFLSDLHLGSSLSDTKVILDIFDLYNPKKVYLVGDILDITAMEKKVFWNKHTSKIMQKIFKWSRKKEIFYIYGNHDYHISSWDGMDFANIKVVENMIHTTSQNKNYLIIHGHQFDGILLSKMKWLYKLGDMTYEAAIRISKFNNSIRRLLGFKEFSLSLYLKQKVKSVVSFMSAWEKLAAQYSKNKNCQGIICGHIHKAEDKMIEEIHYLNCGCGTEFVSFLIEDNSGEIKIVYLKR